MLRVFVIMSLLAAVAFGFPRELTHTGLLSDSGIMSYDSLTFSGTDDVEEVSFGGEVELTGVLEKGYEGEEEGSQMSLRFYPDTNLKLPFLYNSSMGVDELKKIDFTKHRENRAVLIRNARELTLPGELGMDKKIFGVVAARAKVRLKDYRFYGEGDAGHEIYANIERVEILSGISISPLAYEDLGSLRLKYKSTDSYINLRQSPNGTIITQIKRERVAKDFGGEASNEAGARLYYAGESLSARSKGSVQDSAWLGVFYFPNGAKSPIFGYIHESQVVFAFGID
ncbi:hypothetical protein [Helicobacter canis]|uniref:Uncharacterized protein n=1 Tax=Helicobacter canis NCTC 12740 TaxID=1357399 RepID=V8CL83_9HELI|nr:hypothetical protein [Helicobacter canis]ETD27790.1 hypothetical protein HMPREF2087_00712 [Helicobacter canis NCTC 12740]